MMDANIENVMPLIQSSAVTTAAALSGDAMVNIYVRCGFSAQML